MNEYCDFPWPAMPGGTIKPRWTGSGFQVDTQTFPVLSYDPGSSNWSDELTALHEQDAGADHPIDTASRRLAVNSVRLFSTGGSPVILDVGCSSGFLLKDLRKSFPKAFVMGSDYMAPPLRRLAATVHDIPLLQFDLRKCPLPDACLDVVTSLNVLEHIDDDTGAVGEIARILRPGGIAHIEVPCNQNLYDIYDEILMHHRRYSLDQVTAMAGRAGMEIIKASHLGFFLYPAFSLVKKRNQRYLKLDRNEKLHLVRKEIGRSRGSLLIALLTRAELALGTYVNYPVGIRCIVVCRKK